MNTWTDSGLSEAGLIGAKLAVGLEARLPDGPARASRNGSRAPRAVPDDSPRRSGRRRAPESAGVPVAADRGVPAFGVPAADFADSHAEPAAGSHAAVSGPSSLTGSFPLTGVARLQAPAPVPLPSEPLPPEPAPLEPAPLEPLSSPQPLSSLSSSDDDRDGLRSSTDGFLAGGFSSSSSDSSWDIGGSGELSSGLSDSWSRPVPITPQRPIDPAVSAPTSLLPMPKTSASRHRAESDDQDEDDRAGAHSALETYNVESKTLGSLDSSGLFAALSRRGG